MRDLALVPLVGQIDARTQLVQPRHRFVLHRRVRLCTGLGRNALPVVRLSVDIGTRPVQRRLTECNFCSSVAVDTPLQDGEIRLLLPL